MESRSVESISSNKSKTKENPLKNIKWNSTIEFLIMSMGAHATLLNFEQYTEPTSSGKVANLLQIMLTYIVVGVPITYMQVLLGQYTRLGFFYLKRILPLGEGISYAVCLSIIGGCVITVLVMETFFLYFVITLEPSKLQWMFCISEYEHMCWEPTHKCKGSERCVKEDVYLAAYVYWNKTFMEDTSPAVQSYIGKPDISRIWASFLCWLFIYVTSIVEFVKLKKVLKIIIIITLTLKLLLTFILTFMEGLSSTFKYVYSLDFTHFFYLAPWQNAVRKVLYMLTLGDLSYIMFGVFAPETSHTGTIMCFNGIISFSLVLLDELLIGSSTLCLLRRANLDFSKRYLLFRPKTAQMAVGVIPSALGLKTGSKIWTVIYFLVSCLGTLTRVVLMIVLLQQALYQRFEGLLVYYKYISPVFCAIGFGLGCILESKEAYELMVDSGYIIGQFCEHLNLLVLCSFVFYIYGVTKLSDDIHFMTGSAPTMFWKITWITAPIILLWSLPLEVVKYSYPFYWKRYVLLAVMLCPYLITTAIQVIRKVIERNIISLFRPHPDWGPPDRKRMERRRTFNPRTETKYKKKVYGCQHKCLIGNKYLGKTLREEDNSNPTEISVI